jgi:hypothetical protein
VPVLAISHGLAGSGPNQLYLFSLSFFFCNQFIVEISFIIDFFIVIVIALEI